MPAGKKKRFIQNPWFFVPVGMVVVAVLLLLFPKVQSRYALWQEERRLSAAHEQMANIPEATPQTPSPNIPATSDQPPAEKFAADLAALSPEKLPAEKLLTVPFICQNPFQDQAGWEFHKESCEEASLLQNVLFLTGKTVTPVEADKIFRDMIAWQKRPENFGAHINLYGEDMVKFIIGYYGMSADQVVHLKNIDAEMIRKVITLGYPLIIPIEGSLLKNPFYPEPGYHMMSVIGYTADQVITNDVGTKRGEKYPYPWERFLHANSTVGSDAIVLLEAPKNMSQ